eukprot:6212307-Pleurochrysis_carterae.AAC.1
MSPQTACAGLCRCNAAPLEHAGIKHANRRCWCANISPACAHNPTSSREAPHVPARLRRLRRRTCASCHALLHRTQKHVRATCECTSVSPAEHICAAHVHQRPSLLHGMYYLCTTHAHVRRVRNHANNGTLSTHARVHTFAVR